MENDAEQRGWPALHADLARLDSATAARLKPTDSQRIQRALEIIQISGETLTEIFSRQTLTSLPYRCLGLGLQPSNRADLHQRIGTRFDAMLAHGLIDEVIHLRQKYALTDDMPSMRCVGYRQVWEMLDDKYPRAELRDRGIFATRQFAKRQLTWLRSMTDLEIVDPLGTNFVETVVARVAEFLVQKPAPN